MSVQTPITIPTKQPARIHWIGFRVSEAERNAINDLAQRTGVSASHLSRHLLLQAINFIDTHANPSTDQHQQGNDETR